MTSKNPGFRLHSREHRENALAGARAKRSGKTRNAAKMAPCMVCGSPIPPHLGDICPRCSRKTGPGHNFSAIKEYHDLSNYDLDMMEQEHEHFFPSRKLPTTAAGWKAYYHSERRQQKVGNPAWQRPIILE